MKNLKKTAKFKVRIDKRLDGLDVSQVAPEKLVRINDLVRNIKLPDADSEEQRKS